MVLNHLGLYFLMCVRCYVYKMFLRFPSKEHFNSDSDSLVTLGRWQSNSNQVDRLPEIRRLKVTQNYQI